jgi:uncharacterized protein (TIGR02300 family)
VSKPEFGRKMTCTACAVRFYDLTRTPAVCPKCGVEQPRAKPRAAPVARASAIRWSNRPVPPTLEAVVPEPTPVETDPLEEVEEEEEADDVEDIELADDEDAALKVKHDD